VTQETYIRAFERIGQFQEEAGIATWVYRIAVNEALQFLRRRRRREHLADSHPMPAEGQVDSGPLRLEVQDALERLPETERTLLVLKYYEGHDYAEMARILGKPAGTIASGLNRARLMLRQVLEGKAAVTDRRCRAEEVTGLRHRT
jgi:RNA polymerase sigma-70 factor (ECF subfamily)